MTMYERFVDAASFSLFSHPFFLYGMMVALGALGMWGMLSFLGKKHSMPNGFSTCTMVLVLPLSLVMARLVYCLLDTNFLPVGSFALFFQINGGGFAMYGAILGALLGAFLSAKWQKLDVKQVLDLLLPSILLCIMFARFGEGFTTVGYSRPLREEEILSGAFWIEMGEYDAYIKTWMLEGIFALPLCLISLFFLRQKNANGQAFLKGSLLYCAMQTLFESLRYDNHLKYGFIGIQHLLSFLIVCVIVVVYAKNALKKGTKKALPVLSMVSLPLIAGAIILLEYMIDRSNVSRILLYSVYVLLLFAPVALATALSKKGEFHGKRKD